MTRPPPDIPALPPRAQHGHLRPLALHRLDVSPLKPPAASVCTMVLYMPIGGGRWETYSLSGGP